MTMLNKKHSEESKKKMSKAAKEYRKLHPGFKHSKESIEKIRLASIGSNNGMYGKHFSDETKLKMRLKKLGKPSNKKGKKLSQESKDKISRSNTGKKRTLEVKLKISEARKGDKSWSWKGGISKKSHLIRTSAKNERWRKFILEKYNFTCQKTGQYGGKLVVHHINNFAEFPEFRYDPNNGIVLSDKSHREFHNKYGYKNNTQEQLLEFLNNK